jgi:hypothetical protein
MKTKGELIVACIKLMFDNDEQELIPDEISENSEYHARTKNIVESINRAMLEIANNEKLPKKTIELSCVEGDIGNYYVRYKLDTLVKEGFSNDILKVKSIAYEKDNIYKNLTDYTEEGHNVFLLPKLAEVSKYANLSSFPKTGKQGMVYIALDTNKVYFWDLKEYTEETNLDKYGKYIITYSPRFKDRLSYDDPDTKELDIPEDLLDIVPYFVKGDLYETDDPNAAALARNLFHAYLGEIPSQNDTKQTKVKTVFTQVW